MTKNALMICYFYPPMVESGSVRSAGFAENLARYDWHPIVLTVEQSQEEWVTTLPGDLRSTDKNMLDIVRTKEWNVAKPMAIMQGVLSRVARIPGLGGLAKEPLRSFVFPDLQNFWQTKKTGIEIARGSDIIYASCLPYSSALKAIEIKAETHKPVVVDFRDPWSFFRTHYRPELYNKILEAEKFVVESADRLILNCTNSRIEYEQLYPKHKDKFRVITNGFDSVPEFSPSPKRSPQDEITIKHLGSFYSGRQPTNLLQAMLELNDDRLKFVQVGPNHPSIDEYIGRVNIECKGVVPHAQAISEMLDTNILYLRHALMDSGHGGMAIPAKSYEYLACGMPVLVESPVGETAELFENFSNNAWVVDDQDYQSLKRTLAELLANPPSRKAPEPHFLDTYNRASLALQLAAVFDEITD